MDLHRGARSKPPKARVAWADRYAAVLDLARDGQTSREIAAHFGVDRLTASRWLTAALKAVPAPNADAYRTLWLARLEKLWVKLLPKIEAGDVSAIRTGILLSQRVCALMGIDRPITVDVRKLVDDYADRFGMTPDERDLLWDSAQLFIAEQRADRRGGFRGVRMRGPRRRPRGTGTRDGITSSTRMPRHKRTKARAPASHRVSMIQPG